MVDRDFMAKSGIKTVLDEEVRGDSGVPGSDACGEQLPLLPLRQVGNPEIEAENNDPSGQGVGRGPGRPKGAKNKSTEEWRNYLMSRYSSPLIALAETYSRSVQDLAKELGFTVDLPAGRKATPQELFEIFKVQLQCAKELAPYIHQKQPQAIEAGDRGLMQLIINTGSASATQVDDAGEMNLDFIEIKDDENQWLSENDLDNSVVNDSVDSEETKETSQSQAIKQTDTVSERFPLSDDDQGDD